MAKLEPWYKVVEPRQEVREGRSFDPDDFAIHLEQVVRGTAPPDYSDPRKFFSRTVFTAALKTHLGLVLRRLEGDTANTSPVMALVTQFGGGKTHTLTALYHLLKSPDECMKEEGVLALLRELGLARVPNGKVAVFVGNAWDPQEGRETPWLDIARQLAGEKGVAALGPSAKEIPPGTEALERLYEAAGGRVLVLFDETLNFLNRHRHLSDAFFAFVQNLTVSMTATTHGAAMVSLPRSQVEMTEYDLEWQARITKVVRRVAKELIANDESEIAEVVRRRLFEELDAGQQRKATATAKAYADWCFERRAQLPPEWTAVDTAVTDKSAREHLQKRFEACYPFHPGALMVFQRKWQTLPQYQQTRGTLAMLAQWVSWAYKDGFKDARKEPLITLGSAPLEVESFKATVLGQAGEHRLRHAIEADIAGERPHAGALDADTKGALQDIHRRVGTAIFFESSGGIADKVATFQELRFDLGEPDMDTTSIDTAAEALDRKAFYLRKVGREGFRFFHKPRLKKVVGDKRAGLDTEEVSKVAEEFVRKEFEKNAPISPVFCRTDGGDVGDTPRLGIVVLAPHMTYGDELQAKVAAWTRRRGENDRFYPAALVWCAKKPGRELQEKVEVYLAWKRVADDIRAGRLSSEFDTSDGEDVGTEVKRAEGEVRDEVWASYRYVLVYDARQENGLRPPIDLGAGHSSADPSLVNRVLAALQAEGLLGTFPGAGYIERNWPPVLKESGSWPMSGLRKAFLDGSLIRLVDPEKVLREKLVEFVAKGEFGLASGLRSDGSYERLWYREGVSPDELVFDSGTFLLLPGKVQLLRNPTPPESQPERPRTVDTELRVSTAPGVQTSASEPALVPLSIRGVVPPELWNRLGPKLISRLRTLDKELTLVLDAKVEVSGSERDRIVSELRQVLNELGLSGWVIENRTS